MEAIEKYTISHTSGVKCNRERWRLSDKANQINEAMLLTMCYHNYTMMMLHQELAANDPISYKEAEKSSDAFNEVFGLGMKPSDMMSDKNEMANKCIENHAHLNGYSGVLCKYGYSKEDVLSFCKAVENYQVAGLSHFKVQCNFQYTIYAKAVIMYLGDGVTLNELKDRFVHACIFSKTAKPTSRVQAVQFIKDMIRAREAFHEIVNKRKSRALKLWKEKR